MVCKNCKTQLEDSCKFCYNCGARIIKNRLTPRVLLQQINEEFWTVDNKFAQTFLDLFKKPDKVINGYILGTRKRYIGVIPYYALALTVLGFQYFLLQNLFSDFFASQTNGLLENLPENEVSNFDQTMKESLENMNDYIGIITSLFIPFLSIGTWLLYIDKHKHNYTEHLVINLYANAQILIVSFFLIVACAILNISDFLTISFLTTPFIVLYSSYIFQKIYKTSYLNALIRNLAAFFIYMMSIGVVSILVMIIIVLFALMIR